MRLACLIQALAAIAHASARLTKRAVCIVESQQDFLVDDSPFINDALIECGSSGSISLPANQTYNIRTPLDFSPCRACGINIEGTLSISPNWDYWKTQAAVIQISNTTAAVITGGGSSTGTINGNYIEGVGDPDALAQTPPLFSITDASYQIHIRNLNVEKWPGVAFHVGSQSSAVRCYGINFQTSMRTGFLVEQSQHVYVWNNTIRATESCITIKPNFTNVQVEESSCLTTGVDEQKGVHFLFPRSATVDWIRNIFVKNVTALGAMDVVTFLAGSANHTVEIKNATFADVDIGGPAKRAVLIEQHEGILNASQVTFRHFVGEAFQQSDLRCPGKDDTCDILVEDWDVTLGS